MSKVAKYKGQKWANFIHLSLAHWLLVAPAPNSASVSGELSLCLCPRSGDWGRCVEPGSHGPVQATLITTQHHNMSLSGVITGHRSCCTQL